MNALKWWKLNTRMWFAGEDSGGGGSEAPSGAGTPAGDGGGGSTSGGDATPSPSPDGGTPSPASPSPASPAGTAGADFDWSALGTSDDLDTLMIPTEPVAPVEEPAKPAQPTVPAQPVPTQPQQPQETPPTAAQPSVQGSERPLSASDPWRIAEGLEANRDAVIAHLAAAKFALSESDIRDLDTDVTVAVPKLLARAFLESQISMQKFLAQAVPGMVKQFNTVTSANEGAEKQFFAAHRALDVNNPQHRAMAVRIATVYRQANPDIPLNQLIQEVGPMVMTALRMNANVAPQNAAGTAASLPRSAGAFRPAVNGGGGISPTPAPSDPWSGLGRSFDE